MTDIRVTQDAAEVLEASLPAVRITQRVVEALTHAPIDVNVTQYVVETLLGALAPTAPKDYTWQIKDLTDATRWMTGLLVFPVGESVPTPGGGGPTPGQVVIPMMVVTRVVFPSRMDGVPDDCCCH
jgi:hypothetical protein